MIASALGHSDFFYFYLAFLFLLVFFCCQLLKRGLADRLAWSFFSYFALTQAIFFSLQLIQQFKNVFPHLESIAPIFSALSFFLVAAFALNIRDSHGELSKARRWWFVPLIPVFASLFAGLEFFRFTQALFMGIPAIWFVAHVFFQGSVFKTRNSCFCQNAAGASLIAYSLFNLLVDVRILSSFSLFETFVRLVVPAILMNSLWFCSRSCVDEEASLGIEKSQNALKFFLPISLLLFFPLGYLNSTYLIASALESEKSIKGSLSNSYEFLLKGHFDEADLMVEAMSKSSELLKFLTNPSSEALFRANEVVDQFAGSFPQSVAYLMDAKGNTLVSSNRLSVESFVGKNFAFRPYFIESITGRSSFYLAKGTVSKKYGYYSALPIWGKDGVVLGVVVFKITMARIAEHFPQNPATALLDEKNEPIITNRPDEYWRKLLPVDKGVFIPVKDTSQASNTIELSFRPIEGAEAIALNEKGMYLWRFRLLVSKWSFYMLEKSESLIWARLLGISITLLATLALLGVASVWGISLATALAVEKNSRVYQTLVEGSSNIIALMDIYGNFLALNEAGRKEFELGVDLSSVRLPDLWEGESSGRVRLAIQDALNGTKTFCEVARISTDGRLSFWEVTLNPVIETQFRPSQLIGIFHDMTTRKLATQALKQEKDLTSDLLNTAQAIILFLDMNGNVLRINQYFYDLTGFKEEEVIGKNWLENFIPPRDKAKISAFFHEFAQNLGSEAKINQILKADGKTLDIEWKNRTLKGEDGKPVGVISVGQDVTDHIVAENTLRASKSKFAMLNNCFLRFGNSPEENIVLLNEIAWLLTGSDISIVREVVADKMSLLSTSAISEKLSLGQKPACTISECPVKGGMEKIGKSPVLIRKLGDSTLNCELMRGFSSMIVCAIYLGEEMTGSLVCAYEGDKEHCSEEDLNLVNIVARAIGIEIARLKEDRQLRQVIDELASKDKRMSMEMDIARTVHRSFLPSENPTFPPYQIGSVFKPCFSVGGDYFEFISFPDKKQMGILFADISGHGVAGALLASMLKVILMSVALENNDPTYILLKMNERIEENFPSGYFVSAFFALLDQKNDAIVFSNAAPEPALVLKKDGKVEIIGKGGQPMGLLPSEFTDEETFASTSIVLETGDTLLFFTDGITDIKISETERIGLDRFCGWLSELAGQTPQEISDKIYQRAIDVAIEKGIDDDIMLMAIGREQLKA